MNAQNKPLVSICSITYNHAPYIRQCLDGMLMQKTDFEYEIIINDDCSTDGTTEIVKEYASKYPDILKPIFHDENQYSKGVRGISATFVFPKAQGKYIAICEGDDYWTDPLKLQKQVDFLEAHPEYSMCYTDVDYFNQTTQQYYDKTLSEQDVVTTADLMKHNRVITLTTLIRTDLQRQYVSQCYSQMPAYPLGDYPMWLWMSLQAPIYHFREKTGVYRVLEESASHTKDDLKKYYFFLSGYDIKLFFIKKYGLKGDFTWLRRMKYIIHMGFKYGWNKRKLNDLLFPNIKKRHL